MAVSDPGEDVDRRKEPGGRPKGECAAVSSPPATGGRRNRALSEGPPGRGLACGKVPGGLWCGLLDRVLGGRDGARRRGDGDLSSRLAAIGESRPGSVSRSKVASVQAGRFRPTRLGASALLALLVVLAAVLSYAAPAQAQNATDVCDRTEEVKTEIVAAVAGVSDCASLTAAQLAAITSLNLSSYGLTALKAGDFDGLSGLTTLNLVANSIETLPADIFDDLTAVTYLQLGGAGLTSLSAGVFDNNTALTTLSLSGNSLTSLPAGVFDTLTSLTWLALQDNSLTSLPAGIFDDLTALTRLDLNNNSLASLSAGVFDTLTSLTVLNLYTNSLTSLPENAFATLTSLTTLNLFGNTGAPFKPTASAGADQSASGGASVDLAGTASGPWGGNVTWQWTQVEGASSTTEVTSGAVTLTGDTTATPSFTAPASAATLYFMLVVTPVPGANISTGRGAGDPAWVTVTVRAVVPTLTAAAITQTGATLTLANHSTGWWYKGSQSGATCTAVASGTSTATLTELTANTAYTYKAYSDSACTTELTAAETDAEFTTLAATLTASAVTQTGATLTLAGHSTGWWYKGTQSGATCTAVASGTSTATLTGLTASTAYTYKAYSDSACSAELTRAETDAEFMTLATGESPSLLTNTAPTISNMIPDQYAAVGKAFSYTVPGNTFSDAENHSLTYSAKKGDDTPLPSWLTFNPATRLFEGTPGTTDAGPLAVKVTATDGTLSASDTFIIRVAVTDVCLRTTAVRDAIVDAVTGVSDCADLTAAQLAAITSLIVTGNSGLILQAGDFNGLTGLGVLSLNNNGLTMLPAGVFDGLTSLTLLSLFNNSLTSLPAGIFDALTALITLDLQNNSLASLPAGVFDTLTSLTVLRLHENHLTSLPAGIFDKFTSDWSDLTLNDNRLASLPDNIFQAAAPTSLLNLQDNPGAPFKPTAADAGPDRSVSGGQRFNLSGTATGPWGDNVNMLWEHVTGPNSNTLVTAPLISGPPVPHSNPVPRTAPNSDTTLYFRLAAIPKPGAEVLRGRIASDPDWVTIRVWALRTLTASAITQTGATLTIANHNSTGWWYKGSQSGATCTAVASGTSTATLTGLTANTAYTYKAYLDSACSTELTTAGKNAKFTTLAATLTASAITETSATLTITDHYVTKWWYKALLPRNKFPCTAAPSGSSTVTLTGLTPGTRHYFIAYSDSACSVAAELTKARQDADFNTLAPTPTLTPSAITQTGATLTLADHSTEWWYKGSQSDATCTAVASGTSTATLTGLTDNTAYTYKAYSDSACTTELTTAETDAEFMTLVAPTPATGEPTISGTRQVGQTLTAATDGIEDANGLTNPGWEYRWERFNPIGPGGETEKLGTGSDKRGYEASANTYTLTEADIGKALRVRVRFRDDDRNQEYRTSGPFAIGQGVVPTHCNLSDPAEIWCATMTVDAGMATNYGTATGYDSRYTLDLFPESGTTSSPSGTADKLTPRRFVYNGTQFNVSRLAYNERLQLHWRARRPDGGADRIGHGRFLLKLKKGATETALVYDDPTTGGRYWTDHGVSWSAGDTVEAKFVKVDDNRPATGAPAVTGTARVHEELTADTSAIADANGKPAESEFGYQWFRVQTNPAREVAIEGATAKTYRLGPLDWQKQVKVRVAFTDDDRYEESATSALFPAQGTVGAAQGTAAHMHCDAGDPNEVWCSVITVGSLSTHRGYYKGNYGSVVSGDIT